LVFFQVEGGDLDRSEMFDPKRASLPFRFLIVLMPDVHLRPNATHQQAIILPQVRLGDMHVPAAEVHKLGPMLVIVC